MARSQRGRHARREPRRLPRLRMSPTAFALLSLAAVFLAAGALAVHVLNVPPHLRQEGAAGPAAIKTHRVASAHARPSDTRAARSAQRKSPTPTPSTAAPAGASRTSPTPNVTTPSARPSPHPSPSSSSSGPLPLPTLTRPPAG